MKDLIVTIAHDYQCPWCYLSFFQAQRLKQEFPHLIQDWRGYELLPDASTNDQLSRPQPSERFKKLATTDKLPSPTSWPVVTNSHAALAGADFVKEKNPELFDVYNERIYRGFWEDDKDISNHEVLTTFAEQIGINKMTFCGQLLTRNMPSILFLLRKRPMLMALLTSPLFAFWANSVLKLLMQPSAKWQSDISLGTETDSTFRYLRVESSYG